MQALTSREELEIIHQRAAAKLAGNEDRIQVKVHLGTCGVSSGAAKTFSALESEIAGQQAENVVLSRASCIGLCDREPTVTVIHPRAGRTIYYSLTADKVPELVRQHLKLGQPVAEWVVDLKGPRFALQEIRILHNQDIDPMDIEQYIARGGYLALARAMTLMRPEEVLEEIKKSGLRGRGGAGFPTATKWGFVRSAAGSEKYVVCNGDEGDPGAYMNRAVMEGNPHSIIEGMAIGAYCIGNVKKGYAYVRAEYPLAIETLNRAITDARAYGLLGQNILGTGFEFDLEIFPGAGAFVCGEETALLTSIEGQRGNPRQRPPFPANEGLFGKPTTLNNVETWSNVPPIILNGAEWFAGVGNQTAKGTKTLCLVGKVKDAGLVEVPLGTTLGTVIFDLGGGIQNNKRFKGVQLGGPSGGVIPASHLNTPVDYDSIPALGAIMGSGGVVVMDEDSCMVDVAKYFLDFTKDESCGKCISCREGNPKMYNILQKISEGRATLADLQILEELASLVKSASICGLGQTAPNPVLTTLRYFRDEYEAHIIDKKCPAAVCQGLFKAPCQDTCPAGIDVPGYISLIKAGDYEAAYRTILKKVPFPMVLGRVCPAHCQAKCRRGQTDEAVAIRHLKRFAADYAFEHNLTYLPFKKSPRQEKVAIVGAGPAGLAAAWNLLIEGFSVDVLEALPVAGGMLAVGIPEYRLPRKVLDHEIDNIRRLGANIKLNCRIDSIPSLLGQGYRAVLLAIGAHQGNKMDLPGEDLQGVTDALEFLRQVALGRVSQVGRVVGVVGGGNSAIDAARTALRLGAEEVHIFYRRSKADMPADPEEIEAAEQEGVQIHCLTNPVRITGEAGKVTAVVCAEMRSGQFDSTGRRSVSPIPDSEYSLRIDNLIEAIGQRPDTSEFQMDGIQVAKDGRIQGDKRMLLASEKGIFVAGDAFSGPATVIEAIASGQRAALSICRFLNGQTLLAHFPRNGHERAGIPNNPPTEAETQPRPKLPVRHLDPTISRRCFAETVCSYGPEEAAQESSRCLRCDLDSD